MSDEGPDVIVKEETIRKAVDRVVSGVASTQVQAGMPLPDIAKAEMFAKEVVAKQVKVHEERMSKLLDDGTDKRAANVKPGESKARIDRGDVGDDTVAIVRPITSREWTAPNGRAHVMGTPVQRSREQQLLLDRLNMLGQLPEWDAKLLAAAGEGDAYARRSGAPEDRLNIARRSSIVTDFMMKVVEESNAVFGDYLNPAAVPRKIIL